MKPLQKFLSVVLFSCLALSSASAQQNHSISKAFVILNPFTRTNQFFDTNLSTQNPDFTNEVAHITEQGSLLLGAEVTTTKGSVDGAPTAADSAELFYSINGAPFVSLALPNQAVNPEDIWREDSLPGMVNIGPSLAIGVHTLSVYFVATDLNFPLGGPITRRLPPTGSYPATIRVSPRAPDLIACDTARAAAYADGWQPSDNGGFGFGAWTLLTNSIGDGDAAGFFTATNPPNTDLNGITSGGKAWGAFANEGATGGDDLQIAGAFRTLSQPLLVGQTLSINLEHGGIQSGSLSANTPPRTGGWVGFALRSQPPPLQGDPDPFNAFGTIQNAAFAFGFKGGNSDYHVYDIMAPTSGRSVGIPFSTDGLQVRFTLTDTNAYEVTVTAKGTNAARATITGTLSSGDINAIALYNRNAGEDDAFFNNLYVFAEPDSTKQADDDAADPGYSGGWTNGSTGGFGFEPWSIFAVEDGGAAGAFTAQFPGNADLNYIATSNQAWGLFANDAGSGGVQIVTASRSFSQGELAATQSFRLAMEHGGISPVNGEVTITLVGTPTFVNEMGDVLTYRIRGTDLEHHYTDDTAANVPTGIETPSDGFILTYTQTSDTLPYTYAMKIEALGGDADVRYINGYVESIPKAVRIRVEDLEEADLFLNDFCIVGTTTLPPIDISLFRLTGPTAEVGFTSRSGIHYDLQQRTNLLIGDWGVVSTQTDVPGTGGTLILTNDLHQGAHRFYRVGINTNAP